MDMKSEGDASELSGILTRSKAGRQDVDEFLLLKDVNDEQVEVKELLQDQIFHKFVKKIVDPNEVPLVDGGAGDEEEFVPEESQLEEAEAGGSSEDELDEEDNFDPDEIDFMKSESGQSSVQFLKGVPPAMKDAYKKRFPHFWRTQQGLNIHSGLGYEHEDDPEYIEKDGEEELEEVASSSSEESDAGDEDDLSKEEGEREINDLSSMVEDMVIPDDSIVEVEDAEEDVMIKQEDDGNSDSDEEENPGQNPTIADLVDENNDCVYDDDHIYEPADNDDGEMSSDDSYISANEDTDDTTEDGPEDDSETEEVMDE